MGLLMLTSRLSMHKSTRDGTLLNSALASHLIPNTGGLEQKLVLVASGR